MASTSGDFGMPPPGASAQPWRRPVTTKTITYVSVITFLAWVMSVYDYTLFGTLLPVLAKEFGWSTSGATAVNTFATIGVFVVSLVVGPILDKVGRKKALVVLMTGGALASGLTGLVAGAVSVVIIRSFTGLSLSEEVVNSVYLNEMLRKVRNRGFLYSLVQSGWPVGALLSAGITALLLPLVGWRWSFVVAAVLAVPMILLALRLPESPTFQAMKEVKRLRQTGDEASARALAEEYEVPQLLQDTTQGGLRQVFAPGLRRHTISLALAWLTNWMGIQVFSVLGTTVLVGAKQVSFENALIVLVLSNIAGFAGYLFHGWVGDRIGRKLTIALGWTVGGVISILMLVLPTGTGLTITLYALTLFFLNGPYAAMLFYMGESFPAHVRGTGANVAHVMAPLGGIAGSALLSILLADGMSMTVAAISAGSVFMLISGVLMIGTKTTNRRGDRVREQVEAAA
ncbi:MFS transporter [Pseudonocardia alaniniphila]|uniref:MFS transporter n=1 Tax=Pseudonocardia alaniniphila TaxID=75291 RepID=A0ABS9TP04_9PSEU|nr:MFS transporter [Pseudonocardia alaniniphila]MCH6170265.1 MFS transporter [Pseudonocardia alaniniphila]